MAVFDKLRKIISTNMIVEAGPGCVGIWWDSLRRLRVADDYGNVFTVYDGLNPGSSANTTPVIYRFRGTFANSNTLDVLFTKTIDVTTQSGSHVITFAEGDLNAADLGKPITLWGAGFGGSDITATILSLDSATTATVDTDDVVSLSGPTTADIGADFDDLLYEVTSIIGNAPEIFAVSATTVALVTITSSNDISTATINVTVIR